MSLLQNAVQVVFSSMEKLGWVGRTRESHKIDFFIILLKACRLIVVPILCRMSMNCVPESLYASK